MDPVFVISRVFQYLAAAQGAGPDFGQLGYCLCLVGSERMESNMETLASLGIA